MKVLVACEYSGIVRDAFAERGHDSISCDLLPTERRGPHYKGDVYDILGDNWDLMIAHPPCTYLANSGVSWFYKRKGRWQKLKPGAKFFKDLLEADILRIAVENPIPHKYAIELIGRSYDQMIQPYMFGHPERKATCLWLKNLPKLKETMNVKDEMMKLPKNIAQRVHYTPRSARRSKIRSKTFTGIASAMAEQWGNIKKGEILIPTKLENFTKENGKIRYPKWLHP